MSSAVVQFKPIEFRFKTDLSITRPGFTIGRARVCCQGSAGNIVPTASMTTVFRNTGVLLGTNDVVYTYNPVGQSNQKTNLILWGTQGQDFDIYVRCNALPTPTAYDYRGFSADVQEFLSWQQPGLCTYPGTWYIAVSSYNGSGQFNLVVSGMYNSKDLVVRAGTNFSATAAQLTTFSNTLSQAGRQFYGQLEGQFLMRRIDLWNNTGATCTDCGGATCDLCFHDEPGTGYRLGNQVVIQRGYWYDPEGVAHEWGHLYLNVGDEYLWGEATQCGHSNMASPWGPQNNFCYHLDTTFHDHNEDRTPPSTEPSERPAVWDAINDGSTVPTILFETGDNYDYRDHDFNGEIYVIQH